MAKKPTSSSKKKIKHQSEKILKRALQKLEKDWHKLYQQKTLLQNDHFLHEFARDVLEVEKDIQELEEKDTATQSLQTILEKPNAYGFRKISLLDAALSFQYQDPLDSDLCHLLQTLTQYSSEYDNEYMTIFWSMLEHLEGE